MADDCTRKPTRLVLLDRDGVVNFDSSEYVKSPAEWRPIPGSLSAIAALNAAGIYVALCSNQAGIGRGLFSPRDLATIHVRFATELAAAGGHIDLWRYCPHGPATNCACRKPASAMLTDAMAELQVAPEATLFIGDSSKDMAAAIAVGCGGILVRSGKSAEHTRMNEAATRALGIEHVVDDLSQATALISRLNLQS